MKTYVCNPRGYCLGVINAINKAKQTKLSNAGKEVYVFGMLVHNEDVINELSECGITTVVDTSDYKKVIDNLNKDSILIFTAHGHVKEIEEYAINKGLETVDATCSIVNKNLELIKESIKNNKEVIYIGKKSHPETVAALSLDKSIHLYDIKNGFDFKNLKSDNPLVINQTTLSHLELKDIHDDIKKHVSNAEIIDEICDATKVRQLAILNIPNEVDLIVIVGGTKSSNTNKLFEIAKDTHKNARVIKVLNLSELKRYKLDNYKYAAIAAGTSTPVGVTNEIINYIKSI